MLDEVEVLEAQVADLRAALATTRDVQRDFVRRAGHDLLAPLRGLRSLTSFLREDAAQSLDADALDLLRRIDTRVLQMEGVVTSLADYARSGEAEQPTRAVELSTLVADVVTAAALPSGFDCEIRTELGAVHIPVRSVTQCLERIVENAWHHHDRDSGRVSIDATWDDGCVRFVVVDDGPGLDEHVVAHALEPFRAGAPTRSGSRRTGMGLAIASAIATANGAALTISNHREKGTVVELRWPISCPLPFT